MVRAVAVSEVVSKTHLHLNHSVVGVETARLLVHPLAIGNHGSGGKAIDVLHSHITVHVPHHGGLQSHGPLLGAAKVEVDIHTELGVPRVLVGQVDALVVLVAMPPAQTHHGLSLNEAGSSLVAAEQVRQVDCSKRANELMVEDIGAVRTPNASGVLGPTRRVDGPLAFNTKTKHRSDLLAQFDTELTTSTLEECIVLERRNGTTLEGNRNVVKRLAALQSCLSVSSHKAHHQGNCEK